MQRYFCPRHNESTPSCVVYEDYAYCYGGCGRIELSELGPEVRASPKPPPEDLASTLAYIGGLPRALVRGLHLPVSGDSYFVVWPSGDYYKRRKFLPGEGSKYLCPKGHSKPLFVAQNGKEVLTLVEGEINALSLAEVGLRGAIASPGGVGDFGERLEKHSAFLSQFSRFRLVLDADKPGLDAAVATKKLLLKHTAYVSIVLMPTDANDLLVNKTLAQEVAKWGAHEAHRTD